MLLEIELILGDCRSKLISDCRRHPLVFIVSLVPSHIVSGFVSDQENATEVMVAPEARA